MNIWRPWRNLPVAGACCKTLSGQTVPPQSTYAEELPLTYRPPVKSKLTETVASAAVVSGTHSLKSDGRSGVDMALVPLCFILPSKLSIFARSRGLKFDRISCAVSLFVSDMDTTRLSRSFRFSISADDQTDSLVFSNLRHLNLILTVGGRVTRTRFDRWLLIG